MKKISTIISTLTINDLDVFSVGIEYIFKYIEFQNITISVPDRDVDAIAKELANYNRLKIVADSSVINENQRNEIKSQLDNCGFPQMYGWYLQQFIKIKLVADLHEDAIALIWDSDTIPLRPLNFIGNNNSLNYFVGYEYHEPYFIMLNKILGIKKKTPHSFVAQCFPVQSIDAKNLIKKIGGDKWIFNIMNSLDSDSLNQFSEYETLGNYLLEYHPEKVNLSFSAWSRNGNIYFYIFGDLKKAIKKLEYKYSFVAFEKINITRMSWMISKFKKLFIYIKNLFI